MIITLPSGLAGEVRGLKVKELQRLADPALARGGRNIDIMLGMLTAITEPGPYKWAVGEQPVWDQVLTGDRFAALLDVRCATWGSEYAFRVQCEECKEGIDWELDLRDLPRKLFPKTTLTQLAEGGKNEFTTEGPDGERVYFKLLNGADEKAIEKFRRDNGARWGLGDSLMRRILRVDGLGEAGLRDWIDEMDAGPARELANRMDLVDGGVETDIEVVCPHCRWQQWVALPFGKTFFVPAKRRAPTTTGGGPKTTPPATPSPSSAAGGMKAGALLTEIAGEMTGGSSLPASATG
jgi:hypothetical protein